MKKSQASIIVVLALVCMVLCFSAAALADINLDELQTPAEASNWTKTSSSAEVYEFCQTVAENSNGRIIFKDSFTTELGTKIPYMIVGNPAPADPTKVDPDKAVVYVNCNIHSGEVEGKEAMMIFAREVAQGKHDDLLKDLVVIICPNSSPDGNDNLGKNRITTQFTPKLVGTRSEGQGFNVNRDMTKLETVCARSIVQLMNDWDPVLFIDCHATDGSYMRHAITYNWGLNAGTDPELLAYNRDVFCERALRKGSYLESKGKIAVPYGNWGYYYSGIVEEGWRTFEDYARYTTNYAGLRNRLALLLEVYSYDEFSVRVNTSYECVLGSLQVVAKDKAEIKQQIAAAEARCKARETKGIDPEVDIVALNSEMTVLKLGGNDKLTVLSYATGDDGTVIGERIYDEEGDPCGITYGDPVDYETDYWGTFVPTDYEVMGAYYLVDKDCKEFIETMKFHGIEITQLEKDLTLPAESYQWYDVQSYSSGGSVVDGRERKSYEGHFQTLVDGEWTKGDKSIVIPAGTYVFSTAQVMGSLAALMCEPAAVDGGVAWNFFDNYFDQKEGTFRANYSSAVKYTDSEKGEIEKTVSIPILKIADFATLAQPADKFKDVAKSDWFYDSVNYAVENGLMVGTAEDTFSPQTPITRAMIVTMLYRLEGEPTVEGESPFSDTVARAWYIYPVMWANKHGIVEGYPDGTFKPDAAITREQFASILYRYAKYKGYDVSVGEDTNILSYDDALEISSWANTAMRWACGVGLLTGRTASTLVPQGTATRAEAATIFMRFCETEFNGSGNTDEAIVLLALEQYFANSKPDAVEKVIPNKIKVYTADEIAASEALKAYEIGEGDIVFEINYDLKIAEGADITPFTAPNGEIDGQWVRNKHNLGIVKTNGEVLAIDAFGTGW